MQMQKLYCRILALNSFDNGLFPHNRSLNAAGAGWNGGSFICPSKQQLPNFGTALVDLTTFHNQNAEHGSVGTQHSLVQVNASVVVPDKEHVLVAMALQVQVVWWNKW